MSPFVATMTPAHPVVDVRSADGRTATVMLEQGADIANDLRKARTPFASHELAVLPAWAYVPPGHVLAGRQQGVAVVSDDARFDLQPIAIGAKDGALAVHLVASWDSRSVAANYLEALTG